MKLIGGMSSSMAKTAAEAVSFVFFEVIIWDVEFVESVVLVVVPNVEVEVVDVVSGANKLVGAGGEAESFVPVIDF